MDNIEDQIFAIEQNLAREQQKLAELRIELQMKKKEEKVARFEKYPGKITFIQADILTWQPPRDSHWNYAWFDIWDQLSTDNLPQMAKLHRKFTRYADRYGSWGQKFLQYRARQERAKGRMYSAFRLVDTKALRIAELEKKFDGTRV